MASEQGFNKNLPTYPTFMLVLFLFSSGHQINHPGPSFEQLFYLQHLFFQEIIPDSPRLTGVFRSINSAGVSAGVERHGESHLHWYRIH